MITDAQLIFDESLDLEDETAGNNYSTNSYDIGPLYSGNTTVDLGMGEPMYFWFHVTEAFGSANDPQLDIRLISDTSSTLGTSVTNHITTGDLGKATLTLGYYAYYPLPVGQAWKRFLGVNYFITADTTVFEASGKITCGLSRDVDLIKQYATNRSIT
jgi:hypothetical protein